MLKSPYLDIYVKLLFTITCIFIISVFYVSIYIYFFTLYETIAFIVIRSKNIGSIAVKKYRAYKL